MKYSLGTIVKLSGVALVALALVAFVACGGSSEGSDEAETGGGGEEKVSEVGSSTVHVSLNEWSISPAHGGGFEADAGDSVFEIHNEGAAPHDLKIIKTELAPDALPVANGMVDLEAAGEVVGSVDPLLGGEAAVEQGHLEEGNYVLICNIPGHYQQGMFAALATR